MNGLNLSQLLNQLESVALFPAIGAEIEFYVENLKQIDAISILLEQIPEKERGNNQFEIKTDFSYNIYSTIDQLIKFRFLLGECNAILHPKPYKNEPGSAIHFHLSLHDKNGQNQFALDNNLMMQVIAGILATLPEMLPYFLPTKESHLRLVPGYDAPTHICWGKNNRTTALRIPDSDPQNRRIEHRVASVDCDIKNSINAILYGAIYGVTKKLIPPEPVYGIAHHPQYNLKPIIQKDFPEFITYRKDI